MVNGHLPWTGEDVALTDRLSLRNEEVFSAFRSPAGPARR
jgi:hypothetical protein